MLQLPFEVDELCVGCNNIQVVSKGVHDQIWCKCEFEHVCQYEGKSKEEECWKLQVNCIQTSLNFGKRLYALRVSMVSGIIKNVF
jgi:hypothetical protein